MKKRADVLSFQKKKTLPNDLETITIPKLSYAVWMLLQKIDSPFVRMLWPPSLDEKGKIKSAPIAIPTLEDVANVIYILLNHEHPAQVLELIRSGDGFENAVMDIAAKITPDTMPGILDKITARLREFNSSMNNVTAKG